MSFTIVTDYKFRYYDSAFEAVLRYAEAKDNCKVKAVAYSPSNKLLASYAGSALIPEAGGREVIYVPQQEWFNL